MGRLDGVAGGFRMDATGALSRNKSMAANSAGSAAALGGISPARADEKAFYDRKPPDVPATYRAGGADISRHDIENATRNRDGTVAAGGVRLSASEFAATSKQLRADKAQHYAAYSAWHKEGWSKGYIAGSPFERDVPRR